MCNVTNLTLTERTGRSIHKITELKLKFLDTCMWPISFTDISLTNQLADSRFTGQWSFY